MKIKFKLLTILTILSLCSCNTNNFGSGNITPEDNFVDRITPSESKIANFENGFPQGFWVRNDRGNGHPFNCSFSKDNIEINNGTMDLSLTKNGEKIAGTATLTSKSGKAATANIPITGLKIVKDTIADVSNIKEN